MTHFNLEKALTGYPVQTRNRLEVKYLEVRGNTLRGWVNDNQNDTQYEWALDGTVKRAITLPETPIISINPFRSNRGDQTYYEEYQDITDKDPLQLMTEGIAVTYYVNIYLKGKILYTSIHDSAVQAMRSTQSGKYIKVAAPVVIEL